MLFCGEPLNTDSVAMKEQIGVVFDSLCFSPELTVEKAGEIFTELLGTNPYADLKEAGYEFRQITIGE